ncbi:tRNA pseudouridine(55) synthase TruB [Spiroplasma endosymbiont of Crioceris asparagi]|uniref:tRNA pseudouridine(55) synthase TruB n=1 Tax=Spiroplasma endosymbiont of Crioceris asparagi TaxID=3066286 RepID=UPI0030D3857A
MKNKSGFFLVDKPIGMSSNLLLEKIKKRLGLKKLGHCGTLDPQASGLMIVLVNQATKVSEYFLSSEKEYVFKMKLFETTKTLDFEGEISESQTPFKISKKTLEEVVNKYNGYVYEQYPPIYSAIKVNGKKLYEYARKEQEAPKIEPRRVEIKKLDLLKCHKKSMELEFRAICSKGTYIRSLALDIAKDLGTIAYVSALRRTKSGNFKIEDAKQYLNLTLEDIYTTYQGLIINKYPIYEYKNLKEIVHGQAIKMPAAKDETIFISNSNNEIMAIYTRISNGFYKCKRGLWEIDPNIELTIAQKEDYYG